MKKLFLFSFLFLFTSNAQATVTIFACEPEWASLAREIVGNKARVVVGTRANEDPFKKTVSHDLRQVVRTADMVICSGGGLDEVWINRAVNEAGNVLVREKPESLMWAADYVTKKAPQKTIVRVHLNPHNIAPIAAEFTRRIKIIDGLNAAIYQQSYEKFLTRWQKSTALWEKAAAPLKGMRVVTSDDSWQELVSWLGLEVAAKIEVQSNSLSNNSHLSEVTKILKENPAKVIIFANYEDKNSVIALGRATNTRLVLLPFTVGGAANSADLFQMFSTTVNFLLADCSKVVCPPLAIAKTN